MAVLLPDNYLYISHLDQDLQFWWLPCGPESISDSMSSTFVPMNALGRSAPIYTYSNSGPRTVQIDLHLHRDMVDDLNIGVSNARLKVGEDYIDSMIRALQSISVPKYNLSNKAVEPPLVALRLSKQVFIKGVVSGSIGLNYHLPIRDDGKYAQVRLSMAINEVDPYDATTVYQNGSYRGLVKTLRQGLNIDGV